MDKKMDANLKKRADRCYMHSAQALCRANELHEKGKKGQAEEFYNLSARWLMKYNDLMESSNA